MQEAHAFFAFLFRLAPCSTRIVFVPPLLSKFAFALDDACHLVRVR